MGLFLLSSSWPGKASSVEEDKEEEEEEEESSIVIREMGCSSINKRGRRNVGKLFGGCFVVIVVVWAASTLQNAGRDGRAKLVKENNGGKEFIYCMKI